MLEQKVKNTIKKYNLIESGDTVIIGVSGGPDSICLLHILNNIKEELKFNICVCHINHMLRKEADEETEYVKKICENLGIECFTKKMDIEKIAKEIKKGTEETGRMLRYEFFNTVGAHICAPNNNIKIATAHNNNDKIETIIMNILRGSGLSGLKGIEEKRAGKYIRPLIEAGRIEIEEYCKINNLRPKYDKSNDKNIYTRNKVRNIVIPYIKKEFNENIINTLNRFSEVVREEDDYLTQITKDTYKEICVGADLVSIRK